MHMCVHVCMCACDVPRGNSCDLMCTQLVAFPVKAESVMSCRSNCNSSSTCTKRELRLSGYVTCTLVQILLKHTFISDVITLRICLAFGYMFLMLFHSGCVMLLHCFLCYRKNYVFFFRPQPHPHPPGTYPVLFLVHMYAFAYHSISSCGSILTFSLLALAYLSQTYPCTRSPHPAPLCRTPSNKRNLL